MLATQFSWKSGGRILSLALLGGITLGSGIGEHPQAAQAAPAQAEHSVLSFQGPWLCRTWTTAQVVVTGLPGAGNAMQALPGDIVQTGAGRFGFAHTATGDTVHCTLRWHFSFAGGRLISDQPDWVPNPTGEWPPTGTPGAADLQPHILARHTATPTAAALATRQQRQVHVTQPVRAPAPAPAPVQPATPAAPASPSGTPSSWTPVPGHPTYSLGDFAGDPWSAYYGVCTWYAWYRHQNEDLMRLGNAASWPSAAGGAGLSVGSSPAVGATVIFQPGVEGAGGGGHAGHVEQVLGGGWFVLSEMNFYWNGGGFGRVDWRYAYAGPGVSFIY